MYVSHANKALYIEIKLKTERETERETEKTRQTDREETETERVRQRAREREIQRETRHSRKGFQGRIKHSVLTCLTPPPGEALLANAVVG